MTMTNLPDWLKLAMVWLEKQPIIGALLTMMALDIICGLLVSIAKKNLSSSVSWRGMSRKALTLVIIGVAAVLEPFAQGLPLLNLICLFYVVTEAISIIENAAAAGVPLPRVLVDTLAKLREDKVQRASPVQPQPQQIQITGTVTTKPENKP